MNHVTAEIISTGSEILQGVYADTNAQHISGRLKNLGIRVLFHTAVGDVRETITQAIRLARNRADLVFMTGGLGPTNDDLNRFLVSELYELPLEEDPKAVQMIREHFQRRNIPMPAGNLIQARIPSGAITLYNTAGTAPGFIIHDPDKKKALVAMPGPKREWMPMFDHAVTDFLNKHFPTHTTIKTLILKTIDVPESRLNQQLEPLFESLPNVTLGLLAKPGKVDIRLTASAGTEQEAEKALEQARGKILQLIDSRSVYGHSARDTIEKEVAGLLKSRGKTFAAAESCTGGLLTKRLTDIPGSSAYLKESIVTYSNQAKMKYLGVKKETLERYGAVSGEVAAQMASGMLRASGTNLAISITGIAGPGGGTPEKPVGLVYFGLAMQNHLKVTQRRFTGERSLVRQRAVDFALDLARRNLLE